MGVVSLIYHTSDTMFVADIKFGSLSDDIKCTKDNCVLLASTNIHWYELGNFYALPVSRPFFISVDVGTRQIKYIYLNDCGRDGYKYYNVSDFSFTYDNEIYAMVVYFNTPGKITGDEKIVLYRWRRIQEK